MSGLNGVVSVLACSPRQSNIHLTLQRYKVFLKDARISPIFFQFSLFWTEIFGGVTKIHYLCTYQCYKSSYHHF